MKVLRVISEKETIELEYRSIAAPVNWGPWTLRVSKSNTTGTAPQTLEAFCGKDTGVGRGALSPTQPLGPAARNSEDRGTCGTAPGAYSPQNPVRWGAGVAGQRAWVSQQRTCTGGKRGMEWSATQWPQTIHILIRGTCQNVT